jgi:NAD(P)H-dependent FMN reductase
MVKSVGCESKFKPLVSQASVDSKLAIQGSAAAVGGASLQLSGEDLILSATGVYIIIYGAAMKSAGQIYQADQLRNGEVVAVATRTFTVGVLDPVAYIGTAAP